MTCNHCPYVKNIAERLAEGINVLAIMPNDYKAYPEDSPERMKQFVSQHGFDFPYLIDEDQSVGKQYDAVCTPDFFGLNREGRLQYRGRLDNARMDDPSDRVPELLNAMRTIADTGKGPEDQQPGMGCSIKWRES